MSKFLTVLHRKQYVDFMNEIELKSNLSIRRIALSNDTEMIIVFYAGWHYFNFEGIDQLNFMLGPTNGYQFVDNKTFIQKMRRTLSEEVESYKKWNFKRDGWFYWVWIWIFRYNFEKYRNSA